MAGDSFVKTCKLVGLGLVLLAISAFPTQQEENKNLAAFKKEDGADLLAIASTSADTSASASASTFSDTSRDRDRDRDRDFDIQPEEDQQRDVSPSRKKGASIPRDGDRIEPKGQERDEIGPSNKKEADYGSDRDADRDRDSDADRDRDSDADRDRDRDRSWRRRNRVRGRYDDRDRYEEQDEGSGVDQDGDRGGRRRHRFEDNRRDRCSQCDDYEDDDDNRRTGPFRRVFEPMFDMIRRMPGYSSGKPIPIHDLDLLFSMASQGLVGSSSASSFGDGISRSSGSTIHNGRVRGYVSETDRDGKTRTKYIGDDEDD